MSKHNPTRPADPLDAASEHTLADTERCIAAVRRRSEPQAYPSFDGAHCVECGEQMPEARLELKRVLCIDCQTIKENDDRLMGRNV